MAHPLIVAEAWMKAKEFCELKAENNAPYPELVKRWTDKAIRHEIQALLIMQLVEGKPVNGDDVAAAAA